MPIYEYTCQSCHKTFDHLARTMTAAAAIACPGCGSSQTRRALSLFAVAADSAKSSAAESSPGPCGCGRIPGSCGRD